MFWQVKSPHTLPGRLAIMLLSRQNVVRGTNPAHYIERIDVDGQDFEEEDVEGVIGGWRKHEG